MSQSPAHISMPASTSPSTIIPVPAMAETSDPTATVVDSNIPVSASNKPSAESSISANAILCRDLALANKDIKNEYECTAQLTTNQNKAKNVAEVLRSIKEKVHKIQSPGLYKDLELESIVIELNEIFQLIARQETRSQRDVREAAQQKIDLPDPNSFTIVDDVPAIVVMLEAMMACINVNTLTEDPVFSIDIEGGAKRGLSMVQIYDHSSKHAYLVGVHFLREAAFSTPATINDTIWTLKSILESTQLHKLFFDCRGDSATLFKEYNITLAGVHDCQLLDLATRDQDNDRKRVHSFGEAITTRMRANFNDVSLTYVQQTKAYGVLAMSRGHEEAKRVFDESQGDYAVAQRAHSQLKRAREEAKQADEPFPEPTHADPFTLRPLPELERRYAVQDVAMLPFIYYFNTRHRRFNDDWAGMVKAETEKRLSESQQPDYESEGGNVPPEGWAKVKHVQREVEVNWWY